METWLRNALFVLVCFLLNACGGSDSASNSSAATRVAPVAVLGDRVEFSGVRSNYTVATSATGHTVVDSTGADGTTSIPTNIRYLQFKDVTVNLFIAPTAQAVPANSLKRLIELYIAFFNRVPEADGLAYWIERYRAGDSVEQIAESFYSAAILYPGITGYVDGMSANDFVKVIYRNVLGRTGSTAPPEEDVRYWAEQITSGATTRGKLVQTMLNSAHTFTGHSVWGWVPALLNNKYTVGHYFAVQHGLSFNSNESSIRRTMDIASAVTPQGIDAAIAQIPISPGTPPVDPGTPPPQPPADPPPPSQGTDNPPNPPTSPSVFSARLVAAPTEGAQITATTHVEVEGTGLENVELVPANGYTPIYGVFRINESKTRASLELDPNALPAGALTVRIVAWNVKARSSGGTEIVVMPSRAWIIQRSQPAPSFIAEVTQAPASGTTLSGIVTLEVRGSGMQNVELLPPNSYSPRLGVFSVFSNGTIARLDFDTRLVPNGLLRARISAFDAQPGTAGAREAVAMASRDWILRNLPAPTGSAEGRASRCLSSGLPHTRLSDTWPVVCIQNLSMPYEQCKDDTGRAGFGMLYGNPEDGLPVLRSGSVVSKLYCSPGALDGRVNPGCACFP
ncbi:MAG TPA: DUF4214 domain-containing protein [Noviherbaspirillum sp.]|uniref:DUF4214 domain-containing protein n=1 Tax=Noviherbaspirillum sp. TaxID=1926288 RepID=UPI002D4768D7|nr:DUF4214 domain-containing protein [Noviherbaspirillum sp.]HYD95865.1 DUF4214 domain-containing protein [Noviherbaspirillum sp.]